jgi:preprotein translocase subunit SecE
MDTLNSKIITVSFALFAALCAFALSILVTYLTTVSGAIAGMASNDLFKHGLPIVIGFAIFALLQFNPRVLVWANDVVNEARKVSWPAIKDIRFATLAVIVMVIISSIIISVFDVSSESLLKYIIRVFG